MRDFQKPGRSAVFADRGMCATSHPLAAQVSISILQAGGNAVDAAIGGAILLGLVEPQATGIGGDLFVLLAPKDGDIIGLNASGRAPAGLDVEAARAKGSKIAPQDPVALTVPGAIAGFCKLHADHGRLPLEQVLAPAIDYAEAGIPIAPRVALDYRVFSDALQGTARDVYLPWGRLPEIGDRITYPGQAEVLRRIAKNGRAGFYEGEVAEDMVAALQALGGPHTLDDFAAAEADYVTPISMPYRDAELIEIPPNGQGGTAMTLLNILETLPVDPNPYGVDRLHAMAEATKLAYDARDRFVADPDHAQRIEHMISKKTGRALAELIDPYRAMEDPRTTSEPVHRDTVCLEVVDSDRNAVSLIYSIFNSFGSGRASDKFGVLFHNRGCGFTLQQGHPNEAGPGKRPMHTIIPAMLREADGTLSAFGVMGGPYQATGHARFVTSRIDYGMDMQSVIDAPRAFVENGLLKMERGFASTELRHALAARGHTIVTPETPIGGAQAVRIRADGVLEGASDPRKDGIALGY